MTKKTAAAAFALLFTGLSAGALDARLENLERTVDALVAEQHAAGQPGGAVAVLSGDGILLKKCYGLMNVEKKTEITGKTIFDIASLAKQFTAFAVLVLEEDGLLKLDDDIRVRLSGLPDYEHAITVRHLLQHTSGIPSTDVLRLFGGLSLDEQWTHQDEIALIKRYPHLNFEPNTKHVYSNAGYSLLASLVENVGGVGFTEFMDSRIFKPLGMTSSFFMDEAFGDFDKIARGYAKKDDGFAEVGSFSDFSLGGGNMFTSLDDMILWAKNILSPAVGPRDYLTKISRIDNSLENGNPLIYTYGFYVRDHKGVPMAEHSGGLPGFRSQVLIFPEDEVIIILMFNNESINTRRLAAGIADAVFADKLKEEAPRTRVAVDLDVERVKAFEGRYLLPDGMEMDFVLEKDVFRLSLPGNQKFQLFAESENSFFLKEFDAQCTFVAAEDGTVSEMIWHQRGEDHAARRVEEIRSLSPEEIPAYAGRYHQPELEVEYPIVFEDGRLELRLPATFKKYLGFESAVLEHVNGDKFHSGWLGMLEFTRGADGRIDGFILLNVGRLQNLRFVSGGLSRF
ncbi:MAG: serine hydrolase [Acidobacteriota bacterium]|nr:serine hydrolase [Acidobacteriota bacterium]